jgi:hypothetical protein
MRRLFEVLSRPAAVRRISLAVALGLAGAVVVGLWRTGPAAGAWWESIAAVTIVGGFGTVWLGRALTVVGHLLRPGDGRRYRAGALLLAGPLVGWLVWQIGPGRPRGNGGGAAAVLAAAIVLTGGGWACLLAHRRFRAARWRPLRYLPDLLLAGTAGGTATVLFSRDPLAARSLAGLLLPVGAWAAVRTWRAMAGARRLAVRAAADIVLSLLLGVSLLLFLVWLANVLDLPRWEVVAVRDVLARVGSVAELPWWGWTVGYLLLAAASVAFALRPGWLAAVPARLRRVPVLPAVSLGRRVLSGVHIGLMVAVLVGMTAPAAIAATMHGQLRAKYTVALRHQLEAEGARAAYEEIRREFSGAGSTTRPPLVNVVRKIHETSPPSDGEATGVERDLAARVGRIQATTLRIDSADVLPPPAGGPTAHFDPPVGDTRDLRERVDRLDTQQRATDTATRQAELAAELAATAVASTIPLVSLGRHEVVQIVQEYLQGLVEGSRLKNVFYRWTNRLTGATEPPSAADAVVPEPGRLRLAALSDLLRQLRTVRLAAPLEPDPVVARVADEEPAAGAVDLANEARFLDSGGTGPCDGCRRPLRPGEEPHLGPEGPGRPERPPRPPEIHIR